ncbi:MAG: glutaredoxin family protein [Desulfotomaculaceae bacterium]
MSLTTAMTIVLGYVYSQRTWCGFCPMGFLSTLSIKARRSLKAKTQAPDLPGVPQRGIVLFTGNRCQSCTTLKDELQKLKISFKEINIDQTKGAPNYMVSRYGTSSIPVLVLNGKRLKNTSPEKLAKLTPAAQQ